MRRLVGLDKYVLTNYNGTIPERLHAGRSLPAEGGGGPLAGGRTQGAAAPGTPAHRME